jgi:TPR repeat protein
LDNGSGCNNLAYLYDNGLGVDEHNWYAFRYYKKACDLGELEGCYNQGTMYYRGEGTKASKYRAAKIFSSMCEKGVGSACNDLAYMYSHGIHLRKDIFEAISLYSDACQYGEASGCNNLGNMYENGSFGVSKDRVKAERFFIKGCELDDAESCNKLGYLYGKGIQQIKSEEDLKLSIRACDKYNNGVSCYKLGELYYSENKFVDQDLQESIKFFEKACNMGQSQSCKRLGDIHRNNK